MTMIKGFRSNLRENRILVEPATVEDVGPRLVGLTVASHSHQKVIATDTAEAGSTATLIRATGHVAKRGDIVLFTSGTLEDEYSTVGTIEDPDEIPIPAPFTGAPTAGDAFEIRRGALLTASVTGAVDVGCPIANSLLYSEVTGVSAATITTVASFTASQSGCVSKIICSGDAYAKWQVRLNLSTIATKRSGPDYSTTFEFGLQITSGDIVDVRVEHNAPTGTADFEAGLFG